jgi:hypothetical protein
MVNKQSRSALRKYVAAYVEGTRLCDVLASVMKLVILRQNFILTTNLNLLKPTGYAMHQQV